MKKLILLGILCFITIISKAQFLKKLKNKVDQSITDVRIKVKYKVESSPERIIDHTAKKIDDKAEGKIDNKENKANSKVDKTVDNVDSIKIKKPREKKWTDSVPAAG